MLSWRRLGFGLALAASLLAGMARPADAQDDEPDDVLRLPERLTVGVADDLLGQLSPNGQTLYFVSNRNTTNQLFAQSLADGRAKQLFDDDADVTWPRISPDGKWLLYISYSEHAAGQLCLRKLPDAAERRCLADPSAALQAEWIDREHIALVSRQSIQGNLSVLDVTVGSTLSARPLLDRNLTSPTVSPDGRWLVYVPVERYVDTVGPAFAAHAATELEATRLGAAGAPVRIEIDLPGQVGQPVFAQDGRSLYVVQFFSDSNHDGVIDASDHGVLFRIPIAFTGDVPAVGVPEQLTDTSWNCQYPAPAADRLIATCSQDKSLDVYALPLDGEVSTTMSVAELAGALETAGSRVERQILASRRLARETTTSARRLAMLELAMLHLDLEQYRAAEFYAEHVAALHDPVTSGLSHPLLALVAQRRAERNRERGRIGDPFGPDARRRLDELHPKPTASTVAVALTHIVRSEIADSIGDKTQARTELEAVTLDPSVPAPVVDAYYQRADALYRTMDDPESLISVCRALSTQEALPPDARLRYARAAVRAMVRGLSFDQADARLIRERASAGADSELAFALDLARAVMGIRSDQAPPGVTEALFALYGRQSRPDRRSALMADAAAHATAVGAASVVEALAQTNIESVKRGARERRSAERLYRRVMTGRAYRLAAARQFVEARAAFDAVALQTGSYEAVVGSIDMRLKAGERPADIEATYEKPGTAPALSRFAKAYGLARQLPKLEGEAHVQAVADAIEALHASWSDLKKQRIAQALNGALLHERYLMTGDLADAEKANVHYLVALELVRTNPRFRAMILGELGLLHDSVGNYRIALGYLQDRDKLPYTDNAEGLAVHLALSRALLHVGRDADAAASADEAIAMIHRAPGLGPYRVMALDRAALANLAAGRFAHALEVYDAEMPLLDAATGSAPGPAPEHNRFVAGVARAAAAVGAAQPERALTDLAEVDRHLADPQFIATLRWPHASADHVLRSYRLIATGLRANANRELGRFEAEGQAISERHAILGTRFTETHRAEFERAAMLAEAELARSASERNDRGATSAWLGQALARADDLRARANGAIDRDQLDVLWLAANLTLSMGASKDADASMGTPASAPLVRDLRPRLDAASSALTTMREPTLRFYERWFEIYGPLAAPADGVTAVSGDAAGSGTGLNETPPPTR